MAYRSFIATNCQTPNQNRAKVFSSLGFWPWTAVCLQIVTDRPFGGQPVATDLHALDLAALQQAADPGGRQTGAFGSVRDGDKLGCEFLERLPLGVLADHCA